MARYQITIIDRPEAWRPESLDDVPDPLGGPVEVLAETEDLFAAVDRAIAHNDGADARRHWAVVIEPAMRGRRWPAARLCTPVRYRVLAIEWPDGWEPDSPLDVPNCVWQAQEPTGDVMRDYAHAEAAMLGLNRQCMDHPGATWHVVVAVENEPLSRSVSYEPDGTEITADVSPDPRDPACPGRPRRLPPLPCRRPFLCQGRLVHSGQDRPMGRRKGSDRDQGLDVPFHRRR